MTFRSAITALFVIIILFLLYMDNHYWHSSFSYSHIGTWSECKKSKVGDLTHFVCKQGEISIKR